MSFWYGNQNPPLTFTPARGQATLAEIDSAARDKQVYIDNQNSTYQALRRAYDDRIAAIRERTGETFDNPMATEVGGVGMPTFLEPQFRNAYRDREAKFGTWLQQVQERHPDAADVIRAGQPVETDAEALARHAEERAANAMASRDDWTGFGASLWGSLKGSLYDPLQVQMLFAGGGAGGAKTAVGRIAQTIISEISVNGLSEAALQPNVQAWREKLGLPAGWGEAMKNTAFAALAGGAFGGSMATLGEGLARLLSRGALDEAGEALARNSDHADLTAAMRGDGEKAADLLRPIRDDLPAEVRGAIDHAEIIARDAALRPKASTPEQHDIALTKATRAALTGEELSLSPAPEQVDRIVELLVPSIAEGPKEQTLAQFLIRTGGVQEYKGELGALGLGDVRERFVGKLVKPDGMPLDDARRAAAEAGYFNHLYGTAEEAAAKSTVNDLLDELDRTQRAGETKTPDTAGRAHAENLVSELVARAGPAVDDELIIKAAEFSNAEGLDPATALDRVLIENDRQRWAAEAEARPASAASPEDLRGGMADPGAAEPDSLVSAADLSDLPDDFDIPFFDDGRTITAGELAADLDHMDHLFQVVEACRA